MERAAWILAVLLSITVLGQQLVVERTLRRTQLSHQAQINFTCHETIGALRTTLREAKEVLQASERMRVECREAVGHARLRQRWIEKNLGISELLEDEGIGE